MDYPLQLSFKIVALAPQIYVRDAAGQVRMYVKQKMFKLKEAVTVFADENKSEALYHINADRVIDWSAAYNFTTAAGQAIGAVKRQGRRSLWRATYVIRDAEDQPVFTIREANPWSKVGDALFGEIPVVGLLAGYVFHPVYNVLRTDGTTALRVSKRAAFFEGRYDIEKLQDVTPQEEGLAVLSVLMMLLLERRRG